jgi:diguanylate cyclase (GGDEF)-like protein/PAS domain S-box-containing protein
MNDLVDILVVDDEPTSLFFLEKLIQGEGVRVVGADSGYEVLRLLEELDPAVIILDVMMPGLTGFETAERIRGDPDKAAIPIIFVTAVGHTQMHMFQGYEHGAVDYLFKPVDGHMLRSKVQVFVDLKRRTLALERTAAEFGQARQRYQDILETVPVGIAELDESGCILYHNSVYARILGGAGDLAGMDAISRFAPLEAAEQWRAELQSAWSGSRAPGSWTGPCRTLDGRDIEVEVRWAPQRDGESSEAGLIHVITDVTDQRKASRALAESEEKHRRLVESAVDAIFIADAQTGRLLDVNPKAVELLGRSREELAGCDHLELHPPDEADRYRRMFREHVEAGGVVAGDDVYVVDGQGKRIPVEITASVCTVGGRKVVQGVFRDITRRREMEEQLQHAALHDPLTNLANRNLCIDRVGRAIERARRREGYYFAVVFIDLDRFKIINDSMGHAFGDMLLSETAARLETFVRRLDTVSRFGGDEFILLLEELASPAQAIQIVKRVRAALLRPFSIGGREVRITASYGILLSPATSENPDDLLQNANIAMHRAKEQGRDRFKVFNSRMREHAVRVMNMEHDIRKAVADKLLYLVFQPIFSLDGGRLRGFEALVRWRRTDQDVVMPGEFIPIAEETGLILDVGRFVLEEACGLMRRWRETLPAARELSMSLNCSARQFAQPDLVETVTEAANAADLPEQTVMLEITESALMANPELAASKLQRLKRRGVLIGVDDFGTGYSSMSYLQRFPLDELKIDLSFVQRMDETREDFEIVRTIVNLAHSLNIQVVAEGVEKPEQLDSLRGLGCEYGQGYHLRAPMEVWEVESFLDGLEPVDGE